MNKQNIFLLSFLLLGACNSNVENTDSAEGTTTETQVTLSPEQIKRAGIVTGKVEKKAISSRLLVNGIIDVPPQNMISVTFPPGGFLRSTKLLPGMHIRKGETLAVMEDAGLVRMQQDYLNARIRNRQLETEYKRQQELNATKTSSDKIFQESAAAYTSGKITEKALAEQLKLAGIDPNTLDENTLSGSVALRSPIDGYVASVKVNTGAYVQPGDEMFTLVDPGDIHLNLTVFEKDIRFLQAGQKVSAWTNSNPEKKHLATILLIGKELDEHRSVEVHCHFEKYDPLLLPGMFINAEIETLEKTADLVPETAVVTYQDRNYIFRVDAEGKYSMMEVHIGWKDKGLVEITPADTQSRLPELLVTGKAYTLLMQLMNKGE